MPHSQVTAPRNYTILVYWRPFQSKERPKEREEALSRKKGFAAWLVFRENNAEELYIGSLSLYSLESLISLFQEEGGIIPVWL